MITRALAVAAVTLTAVPSFAWDGPEHGLMTVNATETFEAENSVARVGFSVVTEAKTASEAAAANSEMMRKVYDLLDVSGIDRKDLMTSGLSLYPVYEDKMKIGSGQITSGREIKGYGMSNEVSLTVRDISALDKVLGGVIEAGVNGIGHISMSPPESPERRREARIEAVRKAHAEAEEIIAAAGGRIVGIENVSVGGNPQPIYAARAEMAMMAGDAMSVPVSGGTSELRENASVTYRVVIAEDGKTE